MRNEGGEFVVDDLRAAASKVTMRSGHHFAQFTALEGGGLFGVIRAGWDVEAGQEAEEVDGHCFYATGDGRRWPANAHGRRNWEGMQGVEEPGDRIGLLLDLDQGSMSVWKNDIMLGVMQAEGLSGPLCWATSMHCLRKAAKQCASSPRRRPHRRRRRNWQGRRNRHESLRIGSGERI